MSNLAKQIIKIPNEINVKKEKDLLFISGPLGEKKYFFLVQIDIINEGLIVTNKLLPQFTKENFKLNPKALQGTAASLIKQTFIGLRSGYKIQLKLVGVGYKVSLDIINGISTLSLKLGYSHTIFIEVPSDLKVACFKNSVISIFGSDKQKVNNFAASIRAYKKPEPYKGKGILYQNEKIKLKEGKRS